MATAVEAAKKADFTQRRRAVLHSLGLEHTDNPISLGREQGQPDLILEENVIVSFELPHYETGWGHMHFEDSVLVKAARNTALTLLGFDLEVRP